MKGFIEVSVLDRRQCIRHRDIVRLEEGTTPGTTLVHLDSWSEEPLVCQNAYETLRDELKNALNDQDILR